MPTEARKRWAEELQATKCITIALSCAIVGLSRCAYYYQPKLQDDSMIISILNTITDQHLRWEDLNVLTTSESLVVNVIINVCIGFMIN